MATRRQAQRAAEIYQEELIRYPNVTGLGVVPARQSSGESAVGVYVTSKVPGDELGPDELIPAMLQVPGREGTNEVPTRVIAKGDFEFEQDQFGIESV